MHATLTLFENAFPDLYIFMRSAERRRRACPTKEDILAKHHHLNIPYQIPFAANNPQILRFIYRKVLFAKNVYQFGTCFENAYICTACIQWVALRECKQV